jgi:hypothetical protein
MELEKDKSPVMAIETYFGGRPPGRYGADCDIFNVLFSFVAFLVPVARRKILESTPTFLNVVLGDTFSPTQRTAISVSLSTDRSIG